MSEPNPCEERDKARESKRRARGHEIAAKTERNEAKRALAEATKREEEAEAEVKRLLGALRDAVKSMRQFARLAHDFSNEMVGSAAHWAGADSRATAMEEAAAMVEAALSPSREGDAAKKE